MKKFYIGDERIEMLQLRDEEYCEGCGFTVCSCHEEDPKDVRDHRRTQQLNTSNNNTGKIQ